MAAVSSFFDAKMPVTAKLLPAQQCERKKVSLFGFALFAYEIGCAKAEQHGDAAAYGSVLVALLAVTRDGRSGHAASTFTVVHGVLGRVAALEQASIGVGEGGHAQSEDDCCCDYKFLHCISLFCICFLVCFLILFIALTRDCGTRDT